MENTPEVTKDHLLLSLLRSTINGKPVNGLFYSLAVSDLLHIIQFLNLVDLSTVLYPANRQFKRILEDSDHILRRIDLTALPLVSLPYVNKLLNPRK